MNLAATPASRQGWSLAVAIALHAIALGWLAWLPAPVATHSEVPGEKLIVARLISEIVTPAPASAPEPAQAAPAAPPVAVPKPHAAVPPPAAKPAPAMPAVAPIPAAVSAMPAAPSAAPTPAAESGASTTQAPVAVAGARGAGAPAASAEPAELPARPDYAFNPKPDYPPVARQFGLSGHVLVRVYVESDGAPRQVQIADSSGHDILDQAALRSVKSWRFLPAKHSGQAYATWVEFKVRFDLTN